MKLEQKVSNFVSKYPVISGAVLIKTIETGLILTYVAWPEETARTISDIYSIAKQGFPFVSLGILSWPREIHASYKLLSDKYLGPRFKIR